VQVDPVKTMFKLPGTKRLKRQCDEPLSKFAFKFKLRRYNTAPAASRRQAPPPQSSTSRETEAREIFAELDRNGDGAVNIREMILVLRSSAAVAQRLALPQHVRQEGGRGLHSSTFRLNVSASFWIGAAFRGCSGGV